MLNRFKTPFAGRRFSVTTKIALSLILLLFLVISSAGFSSYAKTQNILHKSYGHKGRELSETLAFFAVEYFSFQRYELLKSMVHLFGSYDNIDYVIVTDVSGNKLTEAGKIPKDMTLATEERYVFKAPVVLYDGVTVGYVYVGLNTWELDTLPREIAVHYGFYALVAIIASVLMAMLLTKRILKNPLEELATVTQLVSVGDFSTRVNISQRDEMGELGNYFNNMSMNLSNLINSVNDSIADIHNMIEKQLYAALERVENHNKSFVHTFESFKGRMGGRVNDIAQSIAYLEQEIGYLRQLDEKLITGTGMTQNARTLSDKCLEYIKKALEELENCYSELTSYRETNLHVLERSRLWSEKLTGAATLTEELSRFVVEVALEAARTGNGKLTSAAEKINRALRETSYFTDIKLELAGIIDSGKKAEMSLGNVLTKSKTLHEDFTATVDGLRELDGVLQEKRALEGVVHEKITKLSSNTINAINESKYLLVDMNKQISNGLDSSHKANNLQELHSLTKKLLRSADRLKALVEQYKI